MTLDEDCNPKVDIDQPQVLNEGNLTDNSSADNQAVVWWLVAFTCIFQTLHGLSLRATSWLLFLLESLLTFLGRYSTDIANIARTFPSTLHKRKQYLLGIISAPSINRHVVCTNCLSLYRYDDCLEMQGTQLCSKICIECMSSAKLLKPVITSSGSRKFYPYMIFPYASLISSLESLFCQPGFYNNCMSWCHDYNEHSTNITDVYDGSIWRDHLRYKGHPLLGKGNTIALFLNIDWFQPFKHRVYSIGVIYLAILNLPRVVRFKRENIIIVGLIPGPNEPKNMNNYLAPLVSELLTLWDGISFKTHDCGVQFIRCALLGVGCDLPAGRKVCGFLSFVANLGCSRCYSDFGTGVFGRHNYSGFDRDQWVHRSNRKHREDVKATLQCSSKTAREKKESQVGCRYSCLLQLPYFDPVRMLTIDPMHNLYLGTAKYIFNNIWLKRNIIDSTSIDIINKRIQSMTVPPEVRFNNLPATMQYSSSLTAEQWMLWVNYFSLFCLYDVIPTEHLECWRHFVLASRILCKKNMTKEEIKLADALLLHFCRRFEAIYGPDAVTPNIHLHAHLTECVNDYGPISTFWLFSFERFNGILGDEPTNNRSIEVQLLDRFLKDNSHIQLLSSMPSNSDEVTSAFSKVVLDQAFSFASTKHLDDSSLCSKQQVKNFLAASKYTISSFSVDEMEAFVSVYCRAFPMILDKYPAELSLPKSFKKMLSGTVNGQKIKAGQYVNAKNVFQFSSQATSVHTVFSDPTVRPAKVLYFLLHSVVIDDDITQNAFAVVEWPKDHPLKNCIGKPFEVWCSTLTEISSVNFVVPISNIVSILLTAEIVIENENVLVTVPLIY